MCSSDLVLRYLTEQLEPKYLLPARMTALDATAADRQRAARDVERRPHAVVGLLEGASGHGTTVSLSDFVQLAAKLELTKRPVVLLGLGRELLQHRLSYFDALVRDSSDAAVAPSDPARKPFGFGGDDLLGWALSEHYPREQQLLPWYRLQPRWQNASVAALWRQMHDTSRSMGCDDDDDGATRGGTTGCQVGGLQVRMGFIGQQSNLRATMCLLARYTGLPLRWAKQIGRAHV